MLYAPELFVFHASDQYHPCQELYGSCFMLTGTINNSILSSFFSFKESMIHKVKKTFSGDVCEYSWFLGATHGWVVILEQVQQLLIPLQELASNFHHLLLHSVSHFTHSPSLLIHVMAKITPSLHHISAIGRPYHVILSSPK